jgi:hypothetical protein
MIITNSFFNRLFDLCVDVMIYWAKLFGMTYKEINIWIFCVIEPLVFLIMLGIIIGQNRVIRIMKKKS